MEFAHSKNKWNILNWDLEVEVFVSDDEEEVSESSSSEDNSDVSDYSDEDDAWKSYHSTPEESRKRKLPLSLPHEEPRKQVKQAQSSPHHAASSPHRASPKKKVGPQVVKKIKLRKHKSASHRK